MNIEEYYFKPIVCIENEPLLTLNIALIAYSLENVHILTVDINCTIHNHNVL